MLRRTLFKRMGGLLLAPALPLSSMAASKAAPALRIAHLTDIHLKDKFDAPRHLRDCLHHVQSQKPAVDFILNGGDLVFDMNKEDLATNEAQWKLVKNVFKSESSLPMYSVLGNHDIWWKEKNEKEYALHQLEMAKPYYSFVKGGWKFICLDSVHLDIDNTWYIGKLGEEQFSWLENELNKTDKSMPVCVLSHIPILTATLMIEDNIVNKWTMLGGDMHTDTASIISLFYKHPNVKLCLSGHIHLRDKVVYNNVTYICNGAVSGAWWEGNRRETPPGYGVIDLYADGSFTEQYVNY
ncbi:metallophosphoesterase family protein [Chitinophaga sancti]|uniref:3',5'-cyclic AMP phosphodiesterase CpdA n=1 Tax=Chitinophaga sancti TaxID=1004 RepID=A0A1K1RB22_9BACT|nr:metallophosphoesterase [Chitinophaga sancti]WQD65559.1 metallophosphoesterase [Chitinophaga sancti]WQG88818.1 metallophosphoesterase [Chitinophaga sancti]SFW69229.1 3',5'-cyclic AMP phosphodiesterase CpdA [Chitinophaga sancti]